MYPFMQGMFSRIQVEKMTELSLGGNALLSSINRLQWKTVPSSELSVLNYWLLYIVLLDANNNNGNMQVDSML